MKLTRKFLATLGIDEDKADEIINVHVETVNSLKDEIATLKESADALPAVQKELDELKAAAEKAEKDPYKVKYEALKEDFEAYKNGVEKKETTAKKTAAYRDLLKEAGVSPKRVDAILRVSDIDKLELDDEGHLSGADELKANIAKEWDDFIVEKKTVGAPSANPPAANNVKPSKADILAIKDTAERQKAIAENHELFGF